MNESAPIWETPPAQPPLPDDEVHVWRATLDQSPVEIDRFWGLLSPDERERADRFRFPIHRQRFIAARGLLRSLLSGYLNISPSALRFNYGSHGKPELADETTANNLKFNVSHSEHIGLFAFARNRELGVDVESLDRKVADEKLPERFFSPNEVAALRALPVDRQREGFFNCWTRKEAFIKATGKGLSHALNLFDVSLAPGEPARLLATRPDPQEASHWTLQAIPVGNEFAAAIAVQGGGWRLRCFQAD